jgi:two-component system sensor histidine kinase CpxA
MPKLMRSLTLKIFISYWIAAALVIVALNSLGGPMHRPEFSRALDTLLTANGSFMADTYETSKCSTLSAHPLPPRTTFYLALPNGTALCGADVPGLPQLAAKALASKTMARKFYFDHEMFAMAVHSRSGTPYVFIMQEPYAQRGMVFGVLTPGYTTIAMSVVFTLFLAYILTQPLRRLRFATQQIASGKFDTRVSWARDPKSGNPHRYDEINGLIYDFNQMAERLQTLMSAQHLLLRDVSHELRSPLTRLQVALELARQHAHDGMSVHLDRIRREADYINGLVAELLSLSFMESMNIISHPDMVSLSDLTVRLVQDAVYEAENSQRSIESSIEDDCFVMGDAVLLRRAIENLVRNAIYFTPAGGLITVTLARDPKGESATISVEDTGRGIPDGELDSILKPFYRVDPSRSESTGGSGVGLSIALRSVQLHNGTMNFANRKQGGLCAQINLPLEPGPAPDERV